MSANLWKAESVTPAGIPADGIYACSGTRGVRTNVALDRLAENQTFHCGFSANPGKDDNFSMALCYRDAAGYINYAFTTDVSVPAGKWTRVSGSVVIPSGMTVYQMVICNNRNASGTSGWKVTNPTLSLGSPVTLASSAHTPYATQDHVAAEYATKAALKVTSDALAGKADATHTHAIADVDGLQAALTKLNSAPPAVKVASVTYALTSKNDHITVTAPTVSGYTFVCWVAFPPTSGYGVWKAANYVSPTTNVWPQTPPSVTTYPSGVRIVCYALYTRNA